jgi:hypothetical protein
VVVNGKFTWQKHTNPHVKTQNLLPQIRKKKSQYSFPSNFAAEDESNKVQSIKPSYKAKVGSSSSSK